MQAPSGMTSHGMTFGDTRNFRVGQQLGSSFGDFGSGQYRI